jgi:hypothetical protein
MNRLFASLLFIALWTPGFSQNHSTTYDSSYFIEDHDRMGIRLYFSKKYTDLVVQGEDENSRYTFYPNSGNNLGIGFTYQKFTLNIAMPVSFLNPDRQKDFPKYWDLQTHIYPKKMIVDLFAQFYDGYTLAGEDLKNNAKDYLRKDIKVRKIGFNYNYLFQGDKLSLASAFNQSGIQKRSAASLMAGFEVYGGAIKGDSLILPTLENQSDINYLRSSYFQFGPNAGVAGTLVFGGGFFLTGVASGGFNLGRASFQNTQVEKKWGVVPSYFLRGFFGYNGERFSINFNYVYKDNSLIRLDPYQNDLITGNYRINLVYKISPGQKFKDGFRKVNPGELIRKVLN